MRAFWKRKGCRRTIGVILGIVLIWAIYTMTRPVDEIVLTIGESYEQVRQQSGDVLPAAEPDVNWAGYARRPAVLRFSDLQYGFVTPPAKFLVVNYGGRGKIISIGLSPQVETLPLDDALAIIIDLQNQLRKGGWRRMRTKADPPIEDTPAMRNMIRNNTSPTIYWQAGDKYQISLDIRRFRHDNRPNDERYLITLDISSPLIDYED
jgi:hypothetical protein